MINYLGTNTFFSHNRLKGISRSFYGTVRLTSLQSIKMIRGWCWCVWRGGPDGHGSVFNLFGVPHLCGFPCQGAGQLHQCVQVMRGLGFNLGTMLCVANVILLRTPHTFISNVGICESRRDRMSSFAHLDDPT